MVYGARRAPRWLGGVCSVWHLPFWAKTSAEVGTREDDEEHAWQHEDINTDAGAVSFCDPVSWAAPTLCSQGGERWSREELLAALPAFAHAYSRRPFRRNLWGMNTNHAFALWFTVRALQPLHIVESGVHRGQSTWLLRAAAGPDAWIYALDPKAESFLRHRDAGDGVRTRYFMGERFRDFAELDWDSHIPPAERNRTLVMLDDHMSSIRRVKEMLARGFVHLWFDDNWRGAECYSFNLLCSPLQPWEEHAPYLDHFGATAHLLSAEAHAANVRFLLEHLEAYFEFPPIFDGCGWDPEHALVSEEVQLLSLGLPEVREDPYQYLSLHPPYVQLRPPVAACPSPGAPGAPPSD